MFKYGERGGWRERGIRVTKKGGERENGKEEALTHVDIPMVKKAKTKLRNSSWSATAFSFTFALFLSLFRLISFLVCYRLPCVNKHTLKPGGRMYIFQTIYTPLSFPPACLPPHHSCCSCSCSCSCCSFHPVFRPYSYKAFKTCSTFPSLRTSSHFLHSLNAVRASSIESCVSP